MRRTSVVLAGLLVLGGVVAVPAAQADGGTVLYVNSQQTSGCSDTDPAAGSSAVPFCTLQTGVDRARPGDTVQVAAGSYPPLTVRHSGTADAHIVIRGADRWSSYAPSSQILTTEDSSALVIDGASYVDVENLWLHGASAYTTPPAVRIAAGTGVTLQRDWVAAGIAVGAVDVAADETGLVLRRDVVAGGTGPCVAVRGATGTTLVNDSLVNCGTDELAVSGGASGTLVRNSVLVRRSAVPGATPGSPVSVSADATAGTTFDHNLVDPLSGHPAYSWGADAYTTPDAFRAATGQGDHDVLGDPGLALVGGRYDVLEGSPVIDAGTTDAPGLPDTDFYGSPAVPDPLVQNRVSDVDLGAWEHRDPWQQPDLTLTGAPGQYAVRPYRVTATVVDHDPWHDVTARTVDFGDGSGPQPVDASGSVSHTYTGSGVFTVRIAEEGAPATVTTVRQLTVAEPGPLQPSVQLRHVGATRPLDVVGSVAAPDTISNWTVTKAGYAWGDGSSTTTAAGSLTHSYAKAGPKTLVGTVTDSGGRSASATAGPLFLGSSFVSDGPARVLDTRYGTGVRKGKVARGGSVTLQVTGRNGVPTTGVTAVVLNLTAVEPGSAGYLTAYPTGGAGATTSSLDFAAHENRAALVTVPVGSGGRITIRNSSAPLDVVADIEGYYRTAAAVPGGRTVLPWSGRVLNTSASGGHALGRGQSAVVSAGYNGDTDYSAVVLSVTALSPHCRGYLTVYPYGRSAPTASNVNFQPGHSTTNLVVVRVGTLNRFVVRSSCASTNVLVDRIAVLADSAYSRLGFGLPFAAVRPTRVLDTRTGRSGPIRPGMTVVRGVTGSSTGIPASAEYVLLNLTETQAAGSGYLSVYGRGIAAGSLLSLAFGKGETHGVEVLAPVVDGNVQILNRSSGGVQMIADVVGYFD